MRVEETGAGAFVGRAEELAALGSGLDDVLRGRGRLILIGGEPGIGKSRLTEEFALLARARGALVLWGRSWEAGGAPPYWPWVECLRAFVQDRTATDLHRTLGAGAPEVAQILPELRGVLPDLPEAPGGDPEAARFRLFDATAVMLRNAGEATPLILVLEDIHAADESSLLLLRFLARRLAGSRAMIVATYRDTELSGEHPLTATLAEVSRESTTVRISLGGLPEADVARFVKASTGRAASGELVGAVFRETEGNPLFVGEVVRFLATEGHLDRPLDGSSLRGMIPRGVREVIGLRLARLTPACTGLLSVASVVGREFGVEVLERLDGMSRGEVLEAIDEATGSRVLAEIPGSPGRFRFSHAMIRDSLYEGLAPGQRWLLHRRFAEVLERDAGADPGPLLDQLAHHFFEAAPGGDSARAVDYCTRAAERAVSMLAYEEAIRTSRMALRALDLASEPDEATRCELLLRLGDAEARAGEAQAARISFLRASEIASVRGMPEHLARAALGYGGRFVWEAARGDERLVPLLEGALAALGPEDSALRARVMARLAGGPLRDQVDRAPRDRVSQAAVDMARRIGDPATLAYALDGRFAAVWWPENPVQRLAIADELVGFSEEVGDKERALQGHHYRCLTLLELGDMAGVRVELAAQARIADELRQPVQRWYLESVRVTLATFEGRFAEAEEVIPRAHRGGTHTQGSMADAYQTIHLYTLRRLQGRLDEILDLLVERASAFPTYPVLRCLVVQALAELDRADEARSLAAGLLKDDVSVLPRNEEWLFGTGLLAEAMARLGDRDDAAALSRLLDPFADRNAVSAPDSCTGSVHRNLGLLAATLGWTSEAEEHLRRAIDMNDRCGGRPWAAESRFLLGRLLLTAEGGDEAVELVTAALDTARELGMSALARRCEELLRSRGLEAPAVRRRLRRVFVFTDIVGSTVLVEALGDEGWDDLLAWHDRTLRDLFSEHGGEEINHAGDGFFVAFSEGQSAVACAVAIQRRLSEHRRNHGFAPQVRIGLHAGEATAGPQGYAGREVHTAARIGALAEGGEILVSDSLLGGEGSVRTGPFRTVRLKGIAEPISVAAVLWRG